MYVHAWHLGKTKKSVLDPLELKLQVAVSCHLGAANQTQIHQSNTDADYPALVSGWGETLSNTVGLSSKHS